MDKVWARAQDTGQGLCEHTWWILFKQTNKLFFFVSGTLRLRGWSLAGGSGASAFSPYLMAFLQGDLVGVEKVFK